MQEKKAKSSRYVKSEMVNREKGGEGDRGKASRPSQNVCAEFPDSLAGKIVLLCVLSGGLCPSLFDVHLFLRRSRLSHAVGSSKAVMKIVVSVGERRLG
jgi:hypothetical protein